MQLKIKIENLLRIPWLLGKQLSQFDSDFDLVEKLFGRFFVLGVLDTTLHISFHNYIGFSL